MSPRRTVAPALAAASQASAACSWVSIAQGPAMRAKAEPPIEVGPTRIVDRRCPSREETSL